MGYDAPFEGLTVVDLSQGIAGPYCGMLLAQQGANVIKVEPVDGGDWARALGISYDGQTAYTITGNIGKRKFRPRPQERRRERSSLATRGKSGRLHGRVSTGRHIAPRLWI